MRVRPVRLVVELLRSAKRFGRPWRAAMLVAVGAAGGAAALAVASVPDSSGVIHACVDRTITAGGVTVPDPSHANVTVIDKDAGQRCIPPDPPAPNQTELTWNVTGPAGPTGAPGSAGSPGATGGTGSPGASAKSNTFSVTLAPPATRSNQPAIGTVTLGSGRGALQFNLLSYGFAPTHTGATGSGAGAGKVKFNEIRVVKVTDKASPRLVQATATGKPYKAAIIVVAKKSGGGKKQRFLEIKLKDVLVSSFQAGSGGGGGTRPLESLTLNFASSSLQYS